MKFLHIADLHLGQRHMQMNERFEDFFQTLHDIFQHAITDKVDFCIICGDMFDKKQLDAETLFRTTKMLTIMKEAHIPVFAIEGNHDQRLISDQYSFLDYLSQEGLLTLLRPESEDGKEKITLWDEATRKGSAYKFMAGEESVQIIGIGYITSSIQEEKIALLSEYFAEKPHEQTIVMMHGSIGGGIPGSLDKILLEPLKNHIDYIGLGHWHRHMEIDGWIYNPGSMEHTDINRDDISKGYFIVDITDGKKEVKFFESGKRPALRTTITLKNIETLEAATEFIDAHFKSFEDTYPKDIPLMCKCTLRGNITFSPLELSKKLIENIIRGHMPLLFLEYENLLTTPDMVFSGEIMTIADLSSASLEHEVLKKLVSENSEFKNEEDLPERIQETKKAILKKETPESIFSLLE
ncbi:MAG: exonuclease SbcCD subunit D [Candidatus Gracilibacteria bacterium]